MTEPVFESVRRPEVTNPPSESANLFNDNHGSGYNVHVGAFEGPLDLLLHLIKKNEVDIYDIPIAAVTRQYLEYLELMKELNLDVAGDFLVMASTLLQIKSRLLLPVQVDEEGGEEEEEDPRAELVRRLIEYQKYKEAAQQLEVLPLLGRDAFVRSSELPELKEQQLVDDTPDVELFELVEAFRRVLASLPVQTFHEVGSEQITIADRINDILSLLQERDSVAFEELFSEGTTRDYLIATFLAVLEICKLKMVKLTQVSSFGTIWITRAVQDAADAHEGEE
ncbi:segregation/condensation protein A [Geobacter luticola]|uniref:Segregation and condensation protein A n=1 Tax=Geomobilimonas luticola TaxID=1114878 RepID=A0ABS5SFD7_9BACT|nr:segregation/condensation protein A [Geomobilimonas luticola]